MKEISAKCLNDTQFEYTSDQNCRQQTKSNVNPTLTPRIGARDTCVTTLITSEAKEPFVVSIMVDITNTISVRELDAAYPCDELLLRLCWNRCNLLL